MTDKATVVVFASQKGGAGKTTLSGHLAVEAEQQGDGPVALIDTDPQGSLTKWWNVRMAETPAYFTSKSCAWTKADHSSRVTPFLAAKSPLAPYKMVAYDSTCFSIKPVICLANISNSTLLRFSNSTDA